MYKLTCGRFRSGPFSLATDFWINTCIKLFSEEVVRSKLLSWSALSSHLFLENVKATTGSFSFLRNISIKDSQILRSLEQTEKNMLICPKSFEGENYVLYTTQGWSVTDTVAELQLPKMQLQHKLYYKQWLICPWLSVCKARSRKTRADH